MIILLNDAHRATRLNMTRPFRHQLLQEVNKGLTGLTRLPLFRDVSVFDL